MKLIRFLINLISKISLKSRFIFVLLVNSLVTSLLVGIVSFYNISSLHENKVKSGIQSSLNNISINIDNAYKNLDSISKLFLYENTVLMVGNLENDLKEYIRLLDNSNQLSDQQLINFVANNTNIQQKINFISTANPIVGQILIYRPDENGKKQLLFSYANSLSGEVNIPQTAVYTNVNYITYFGIHTSLGRDSYNVISIERKIEISPKDIIYVYMEVNGKWLDNLIHDKQSGINATFVMTDSNNRVVFSDNKKVFAEGSIIKTDIAPNSSGEYKNFYIFNGPHDNGWKIMEIIDKNDYNKEIVKWLSQFILICIISLTVAGLLVIFIWRSIYKPINVLRKEFKMLGNNQFDTRIRKTRIKEFDELLLLFYKARESNALLMKQIELKERKQKELEVEKLLIQINPHFMHNTLNSIQWMARLNNQKDIEKMATLFGKVLNYNLGNNSIIVTVSEEINALNNYIELQKMRYEFNLDVIITVQQSVKEVHIPRFILQPLVENAIFHGMNENGTVIRITITQEEDMISFVIEDNGAGMDKEKIEQLLNGVRKVRGRNGMGIGLKYVKGMIKYYYGEQYGIQIDSEIGVGTTVRMLLPLKLKEDGSND